MPQMLPPLRGPLARQGRPRVRDGPGIGPTDPLQKARIVARRVTAGCEPLRYILQVVPGIAFKVPFTLRRKAPHIDVRQEPARSNLGSSHRVTQMFPLHHAVTVEKEAGWVAAFSTVQRPAT
jgi:hypothetical protein